MSRKQKPEVWLLAVLTMVALLPIFRISFLFRHTRPHVKMPSLSQLSETK